MSDHLIAEANRHAMALPTTHPTHADIAWYVREVSELRAEVKESKGRERVAIASWDEERQRALREGGRVVELRAEVERLRSDRDCEKRLRKDADEFRENAIERAVKAEADLATERARLADLIADLSDACITLESAESDCDDYAMQNTAFKLMAVRNVFAAMKEGAK